MNYESIRYTNVPRPVALTVPTLVRKTRSAHAALESRLSSVLLFGGRIAGKMTFTGTLAIRSFFAIADRIRYGSFTAKGAQAAPDRARRDERFAEEQLEV